MATTTPSGPFPVETSRPRTTGDAEAVPQSFPPIGTRDDDAPGVARSAVPVVVSMAMLFGLAVGVAFVGRALLDMFTGLMTP